MALSLAFLGPFLGLCGGAVVLHRWPCPWPPVGLSGPFLRFLGCWLAPAAAVLAGGGFSGGLGWPPLAFPLGFVGSGWSGPSGPLRAFLRPFPGLSCVFSGAGCWCPCGESYLGPPWVPVGVLSEVLGWSCWDPGRRWSKMLERLSPPAAGMVFVEGVRGVSKMAWGREVFSLLIFYLCDKFDKYSLISLYIFPPHSFRPGPSKVLISPEIIYYIIYISPDQSIQSPDQSQIRNSNNILYNICIYIWVHTLSYNYSIKTN